MDSNPFGAIVGGIIGAVVGAILSAYITIIFRQEIGIPFIAVGFLTGFLVRTLGKGTTSIYGIIGALFTIIGCTLGKLLTVIIVQANDKGITITEALKNFDLTETIPLVEYTFNKYDYFVYIIAIVTAYMYSIHKGKQMHFRRR